MATRKELDNAPRSARTAPAHRRQASYWDLRYRSDPSLFGKQASPFLRWVLDALPHGSMVPVWVELGAGYGRDLTKPREVGYRARGVDVSRVGTQLARRAGFHVARAHALDFLLGLEADSVGVVFSNILLNMEFTEADHRRLFAQVARVLAPGGFHAYSVRAVSDPWYGRGTPVGPDMFDLAPDGPVLHFFSRAYARRLRSGRFRPFRLEERAEDHGDFPVRVLYVLDRKPLRRARGRTGPIRVPASR